MIGLESSWKEIFSIYHFEQWPEKLCLVLKRRCVRGGREKGIMWLRSIERLKLVIPRQGRKEVGGSESLIALVVPLGYVNKIWTFGRKEAGEHSGAAGPGNVVRRGRATQVRLTASL